MTLNAFYTIIFIFMFVNDGTMVRLYASIVTLTLICIFTHYLSHRIYLLLKKNRHTRSFIFFGVSFLILGIYGVIIIQGIISDAHLNFITSLPGMSLSLGFLLLYSVMTLGLVRKFISKMNKADVLNEILGDCIAENTRLSEKLSTCRKKTSLTITDETEKKLKEVIKYINENFQSNLSLSMLAERAETRPDSFGKRFKLYIGKKFWDYIYELRIKEAARRLREENTNIIDIAFDVGFESLRTFNRAFPKFMDTTPALYRKSFREKIEASL